MKKTRFIFKIMLGIYVLFMIFALFLYNRPVSTLSLVQYIQRFSNIVPFATFGEYIYFLTQGRLEIQYVLLQIAQNILLFLPLGTLMPLCFDKFKSFKTTLTLIPCFFVIEICQLVFKVGSFDIDDIILYFCGMVLGYAFYKLISKYTLHRQIKATV
ncbi:MAG: VanZ family protein [Clostridia bacterium]|nr:VanZ family protein [Clostridia bacterium]